MTRIVLDLQGAQTPGSRSRGIGRYLAAFSKGIAAAGGPDLDLRIVLNGDLSGSVDAIIDDLAPEIPRSAFSAYLAPVDFDVKEADRGRFHGIADAARRLHYASLAPDAIIIGSPFEGLGSGEIAPTCPALPGVPTFSVLYDLIPYLFPEQFLSEAKGREHYMRQLNVLRESRLLLSISEASRADGIEHLRRDAGTIVNVGTAVSDIFHSPRRAHPPPQLRGQRYILTAGGADPNKNLRLIVEAYCGLDPSLRRNVRLVHMGKLSETARRRIERPVEAAGGPPIVFLGMVSDQGLLDAIDHADVFAFPSLYEGFGLPVLEAMTRSTPALACRTSALPEVVANEDALIEPDDVDEWIRRLTRVLTDAAFRSELKDFAVEQAKTFSWIRVGRTALDAIESDLSRRKAEAQGYGVPDALAACASATRDGRRMVDPSDIADSLLFSGRLGHELGPPRLLLAYGHSPTRKDLPWMEEMAGAVAAAMSVGDPGSSRFESVAPVVFENGHFRPTGRDGSDRSQEEVLYRTGDTWLMVDPDWASDGGAERHLSTVREFGGRVVSVLPDLSELVAPRPPGETQDPALLLLGSDAVLCTSDGQADELAKAVRDDALRIRDGLRVGCWPIRIHREHRQPIADGAARLLDIVQRDRWHGVLRSPPSPQRHPDPTQPPLAPEGETPGNGLHRI